MATLRTLLFFAGWISATLVFGILGLPCLLRQRWCWWAANFWVNLTLGWLRLSCGIRSEHQGIPATPLIASKHQSAWDTLMLWRVLGNPVFVLKRELYAIPIFGWYLWRSGQIAINRAKGREAYAQIETQAKPYLAQGRVMVVFPEGTRVPVGTHKPFHSGIARISAMLQLAVTPAAVNAGLFWPKHSLVKHAGTARLAFLPPLPVSPDDRQAWMQQLETSIETKTAELCVAETARNLQSRET